VRVGPQREARVGASQVVAHGPDALPGIEEDRGEVVPQRVHPIVASRRDTSIYKGRFPDEGVEVGSSHGLAFSRCEEESLLRLIEAQVLRERHRNHISQGNLPSLASLGRCRRRGEGSWTGGLRQGA
jgi:hypothetical protein